MTSDAVFRARFSASLTLDDLAAVARQGRHEGDDLLPFRDVDPWIQDDYRRIVRAVVLALADDDETIMTWTDGWEKATPAEQRAIDRRRALIAEARTMEAFPRGDRP